MSSLRARLVLRMVLVVSLFGLTVSGIFHVVTRSLLLTDFEHELETEITFVAGLTKVFPDGDVYVDLDSEVVTDYAFEANRVYQVWDAELAEILDRSVWLEQTSNSIALANDKHSDAISRFDTVLPDGRPARAHVKLIDAQWGWFDSEPEREVSESIRSTTVWLMVARDRTDLNYSLNRLTWLTVAMACLLPLLAGWAVRWTVKHSLKPLSAVTLELAAVRSTSPAHRLSMRWPEEIQPLTRAFNELLERLNRAESRQRRFSAAAAHELRTPIAELRTITDVALRGQQSIDRLIEALRQSNGVSRRMQETVQCLLELARHQSQSSLTPPESVDMSALLMDIIDEQRVIMHERSITIDTNLQTPIAVETHQPPLRMLLATLVSNAVAHSPRSSTVAITLKNKPLRLTIENDAPALSESDIERLFDPFWRPPSVTSTNVKRDAPTHFGLGLALAKDAADQGGLELTVVLKDSRICFCVSADALPGAI